MKDDYTIPNWLTLFAIIAFSAVLIGMSAAFANMKTNEAWEQEAVRNKAGRYVVNDRGGVHFEWIINAESKP